MEITVEKQKRGRGARRLLWAAAAALTAAFLAAGLALAEPPTVIRAGNLILTLDGEITPRVLPRDERVPIGFHGSGDLRTVDGSHPPALREVVLDLDRDGAVDVGGIPVCPYGRLAARDTATVRRICAGARLGQGNATVEVSFPEQAPIVSTGPLTLFNGGEKGGVTTLFLHAYVDIPAPTAVIATARLSRQDKGPYGLRLVFEVPTIANGAGSLVHSELTIPRSSGFIFARCSRGLLQARGTFEFRDGTALAGTVVRRCTARE